MVVGAVVVVLVLGALAWAGGRLLGRWPQTPWE